jgi:hypothetical protein
MAITINTATTMPATLRAVFTTIPPEGGTRRGRQSVETESVYQKRRSLVVRSFATAGSAND